MSKAIYSSNVLNQQRSNSPTAQIIICELSICPASEVSIDTSPKDFDMRKILNQFHKLYYKIDDAKKNEN